MLTYDEFKKIFIFYIIRFIFVFLALYIGYKIVNNFIVPQILDKMCLTNTSNCISMEIYYYQNTFLAKEEMSQIYFWYDGNKVYIYGLAPETCQQPRDEIDYMPANIFQLSRKNNHIIFTPFPNKCVTALSIVLNYYKNTLGIEKNTIFLHKYDNNSYITNIFDILKTMIENNIFSVDS